MTNYRDSWQYKAIAKHYEDKKATRSGLPYIKHIDEGVEILKRIETHKDTITAFILHPLFQGDEALGNYWKNYYAGMNNLAERISKEELVLVLEYRNLANNFLSKDFGIKRAQLSPIRQVNLMLLADKVQNQADFYRYQSYEGDKPTLTKFHYTKLEGYFSEWRELLTKEFPILMEQFPLDEMIKTKQLFPIERYPTMKIREGKVYDNAME